MYIDNAKVYVQDGFLELERKEELKPVEVCLSKNEGVSEMILWLGNTAVNVFYDRFERTWVIDSKYLSNIEIRNSYEDNPLT